jgi:hypothetical protein
MKYLKELENKFRNCWIVIPMIRILLYFMTRKEVNEMAVIYATLIVKGKKTFNQVPLKLKDQVKEILIDLEVPELAE